MPSETRLLTAVPAREVATSSQDGRLVAAWLFAICAMILVMVVLGGITRLTGSGLSIMEWAPLSGALPPLSHSEWERLFALYKTIPQYDILHPGMGLAGFQRLFWIEWTHRLWGRLLGVAFIGPLLWFWATGRIDPLLRSCLILFFVLGGLQGAVGWFMVASGFLPDSTAVAPVRLAMHLALALILYGAIFWTALDIIGADRASPAPAPRLRPALIAFLLLLSVTIVAGSFVAGTHAGFEYNTFPLMEGHWVPPGYARLQPVFRNLTQNLAAVQFDHRLLATVTMLTGLAIALAGVRERSLRLRQAAAALGGLIILQYVLGVATLLLVVPTALAALHQANAILVLSAGLWALHATRSRGHFQVVKTGPTA